VSGLPCTRHRVFLATLVVAAKYLNDSSPKNKHWAHYARLFDGAELNLMEKQLLFLLDFDLSYDEATALRVWQPFLASATAHAAARRAARELAIQKSRPALVQRVSRANLRQRLSVIVPSSSMPLPTPEPTPADVVMSSAVSSSRIEVPVSAPANQPTFLAVPSVPELAHARTHSVLVPGQQGMLSTVSLASTSSEASSVGSLTDDAGTSSSSDEEARSPTEAGEPMPARSRTSFLRLLGTGVAKPRSRHASSSTITPGVYTAAIPTSSSESVTSPVQPTTRRALGAESKRFSSVYARRSGVVDPALPTSTSTASFLSRLWGGNKEAIKPALTDDFHVVESGEESDIGDRSLSQRAHPLGPRAGANPLRKFVRVSSTFRVNGEASL
jgi:G1/S-specific cyclin PLC1